LGGKRLRAAKLIKNKINDMGVMGSRPGHLTPRQKATLLERMTKKAEDLKRRKNTGKRER